MLARWRGPCFKWEGNIMLGLWKRTCGGWTLTIKSSFKVWPWCPTTEIVLGTCPYVPTHTACKNHTYTSLQLCSVQVLSYTPTYPRVINKGSIPPQIPAGYGQRSKETHQLSWGTNKVMFLTQAPTHTPAKNSNIDFFWSPSKTRWSTAVATEGG